MSEVNKLKKNTNVRVSNREWLGRGTGLSKIIRHLQISFKIPHLLKMLVTRRLHEVLKMSTWRWAINAFRPISDQFSTTYERAAINSQWLLDNFHCFEYKKIALQLKRLFTFVWKAFFTSTLKFINIDDYMFIQNLN